MGMVLGTCYLCILRCWVMIFGTLEVKEYPPYQLKPLSGPFAVVLGPGRQSLVGWLFL